MMWRNVQRLAACALLAFGVAAGGVPLPGVPLLRSEAAPPAVTVTWYGVTTLLFDDGETKILIDGFFSRPEFDGLDSMAEPDAAQIDRIVEDAGLAGTLAMITPVHSHFDHAMDVGAVALATGAVVLGSASTANIARGAGVDEAKIVVVEDRHQARFGRFVVGLVRSAHAPLVDGGPPIPGTIDAPLAPPARIGDWKEGGSFSIVLAHPAGTAVVQGSAGYVEGALDDASADAVYLGIGGLGSLGKDHAARYFAQIVAATGASCVLPIHWDDFTRPFGEIVWRGSLYDVGWLREFAAQASRPVGFAQLPFGEPVNAFPACGANDP